MQCTGEQYTTGSGGLELVQVGTVSYAAGCEKSLLREIAGVGIELCHVRALMTADAFQVHQNDVAGPVLGVSMDARRVTQPCGIMIDRQDKSIAFDARWRLPGLGPDDRHCRELCGKTVQSCGAAQARIDPYRQTGECRQNRSKQIDVIAAIENGVEIRDVQGAEVEGLGQASYQW